MSFQISEGFSVLARTPLRTLHGEKNQRGFTWRGYIEPDNLYWHFKNSRSTLLFKTFFKKHSSISTWLTGLCHEPVPTRSMIKSSHKSLSACSHHQKAFRLCTFWTQQRVLKLLPEERMGVWTDRSLATYHKYLMPFHRGGWQQQLHASTSRGRAIAQ